MRSAASRSQGTISSTQSGLAETTSMGRACGLGGQDVANEGHEGLRLDGLGDVPVSVLANRPEERLGRVVGRHDHDPGLRGLVAEMGQHLQAVHARHPDVEQDEVRGSSCGCASAPRPRHPPSRRCARRRAAAGESAAASTDRHRRRGFSPTPPRGHPRFAASPSSSCRPSPWSRGTGCRTLLASRRSGRAGSVGMSTSREVGAGGWRGWALAAGLLVAVALASRTAAPGGPALLIAGLAIGGAIVFLWSGSGRTNEALRRSEERFRALIEHATEAISVLDSEGKRIYASPAASRILGYSEDELVGGTITDQLHPDDVPLMRQAQERLLASPGEIVEARYRLRHRDGEWRWLEARGRNLLDNPSVRGMVANYRDVTDRKKSEDALRLSEERFRALVENAADSIALVDAQGHFISSGGSAHGILGYSDEEMVGRSFRTLVHPVDAGSADAVFARVGSEAGWRRVLRGARSASGRDLEMGRRRGQEPPGRAGGECHRRELSRRHRAQGSRGGQRSSRPNPRGRGVRRGAPPGARLVAGTSERGPLAARQRRRRGPDPRGRERDGPGQFGPRGAALCLDGAGSPDPRQPPFHPGGGSVERDRLGFVGDGDAGGAAPVRSRERSPRGRATDLHQHGGQGVCRGSDPRRG